MNVCILLLITIYKYVYAYQMIWRVYKVILHQSSCKNDFPCWISYSGIVGTKNLERYLTFKVIWLERKTNAFPQGRSIFFLFCPKSRGTSSINLVILYNSFQGTNWFPRETSRTLIDGHLSLSHSESVTFLDKSFRSVNFILTCPLNFSYPRIIPNHNLQVAVTFFSDFLSRYEKRYGRIFRVPIYTNPTWNKY